MDTHFYAMELFFLSLDLSYEHSEKMNDTGFLLEEKKKLDDLWRKKKEEVKKNSQKGKTLDSRWEKKVVYNNSSRVLSEKEIELLSLGLKFGMTPKKFPLVEYITATEMLCKSLEETGEPDGRNR